MPRQAYTTGSLFEQPESVAAGYARVALDTPVRREFSYRIPAELEPVEPGHRVRVPFGRRDLVGVVVGVDPHPPADVPAERLRPITARLDAETVLTPALLRLARQLASDTYCSWGQAAAAMLPAVLRRDRARRTILTVELARAVDPAEQEALAKSQPKQERALAHLMVAGGPVEVRDFMSRTGLSRSPLDSLRKRGLVRFRRVKEMLDPLSGRSVEPDRPPQPTARQQECIDAVRAALEARRQESFLLYGVTGSGKTEIYLRALETCLQQGRGAIVLVPEIALTPQTVARFRARCGEVAVLHSGLTDAERHDQWLALRRGRPRVVVGARSALFAPVPDLGLLVLDEEHESSFKQESTPRYHARDAALERARLEGAVCVLGSATPSMEAWREADRGRLRLLTLPERVAGGRLPEIQLVDMREQKPDKGQWLVLSRPLQKALGEALARDERAILFLNRRGFAPAWHCRHCGGSVHCPRCDVALTYHRWRRRALCHLCLAEQPAPERCAKCGQELALVGVGTERAEDTLARLFPGARVARMDRDTMLRRESYEEVLHRFGAGEIDVLLGTQMVAKGLDFPAVTVVGVLNADIALHQPDFRAAERCFNLISQVAGRAGRGERPGRVFVQTWYPEHPAIQSAVHHDYEGFARRELVEREEFGYPPAVRAVRILIEAADGPRADRAAGEVAVEVRRAAGPEVTVLGPAPPPQEKLRGRYRRQLLVKLPGRRPPSGLHEALGRLSERPGVTLDVL